MNRNLQVITHNAHQKYYSVPKVRQDIETILKTQSAPPVTLLQYPYKPQIDFRNSSTKKHIQQIRDSTENLVVLCHDIKTLQAEMFASGYDVFADEQWLFAQADTILTHTDAMSAKIQDMFDISTKCISLGLFDYLGHANQPTRQIDRVVFAGYLGKAKVGMLDSFYSYPQDALPLEIYGEDFDQDSYPSLSYAGRLHPDELPSRLTRSAGLIWDELTPLQKDYYAIISPHKLSAYICAGIPIIAPKDSYAGQFVSLHGIGFTINSLDEIASLDFTQINYEVLTQLQAQVQSGHFIKAALEKI